MSTPPSTFSRMLAMLKGEPDPIGVHAASACPRLADPDSDNVGIGGPMLMYASGDKGKRTTAVTDAEPARLPQVRMDLALYAHNILPSVSITPATGRNTGVRRPVGDYNGGLYLLSDPTLLAPPAQDEHGAVVAREKYLIVQGRSMYNKWTTLRPAGTRTPPTPKLFKVYPEGYPIPPRKTKLEEVLAPTRKPKPAKPARRVHFAPTCQVRKFRSQPADERPRRASWPKIKQKHKKMVNAVYGDSFWQSASSPPSRRIKSQAAALKIKDRRGKHCHEGAGSASKHRRCASAQTRSPWGSQHAHAGVLDVLDAAERKSCAQVDIADGDGCQVAWGKRVG
ncbi:hypothetical protein FA95DRAFT_1577653 [Auriscalpium vulgare]|uniref:Uncharacterized protein n=1 Tax=Auriscalpium vulgare TaxID=40419 RepID=A0ACB8R5Z9_9AGAM|nr:hypothetical protein FA95DRAFT_1577653 [Auriscalpium vulgare]